MTKDTTYTCDWCGEEIEEGIYLAITISANATEGVFTGFEVDGVSFQRSTEKTVHTHEGECFRKQMGVYADG